MQMSNEVITKVPGNAYVNMTHIPRVASKDKSQGGREGGEEREKRDTERICAYVCTSLR